MKAIQILLALSLLSLVDCASSALQSGLIPSGMAPRSANQYEDVIKAHTRHDQAYNGFYNLFELNVTMLNSMVRGALIDKSAEFLQWDAEQTRNEREKMFQEMSNEASYFISFFAPERRHNDLDKPESMWKVYLEANGTRYTAKIKKYKSHLVQIQALYPHHTRFNTAYIATFPVAMTAIEKYPTKVIVTSTQGAATLQFSAVP